MTKILITGATGNVGIEVIKSLHLLDHQLDISAGVRDLVRDKEKLANYRITLVHFDFTDINSYEPALVNCDILFLLRPPQIADVDKYFKPLIEMASLKRVKHVVFLSVQGVENSKIIPHHKIEKLIVESKIPFTFLRPAYFMQNFTTILRNDLVNKSLIFLPAGQAKFTLIDVRDIGRVAANILLDIAPNINQSYDLTSDEKLTFGEMAVMLSDGLGRKIQFKSPNLASFYLQKRKEKIPSMFILVMIMLHYFPRFQKEPVTADSIEKITGSPAISFVQFIRENKKMMK